MAKIEIFEPALTCKDGICQIGENTDLARIDAMVKNFNQDGLDVTRYNLTTAPAVFQEYPPIADLIAKRGISVLPVTLVDGLIAKTHEYPTALEFIKWLKGE